MLSMPIVHLPHDMGNSCPKVVWWSNVSCITSVNERCKEEANLKNELKLADIELKINSTQNNLTPLKNNNSIG